jgi:hypothetical protein
VRDEDEDEAEFQRCLQGAGRSVPADKPKASRKNIRDQFVQVPLWWAEQATHATGTPKAFVWVWLLHLAWKAQSATFPLPNGQLRARGVHRDTKYHALRELEAAGLIKVTREGRKTLVVTLLYK